MPKATKYYTEEELDNKIKQLEALKAKKVKEREERLNMTKIAYMNSLLEDAKIKPEFKNGMTKRINDLIQKTNPRKEKKLIAAYKELLSCLQAENKDNLSNPSSITSGSLT